VLAGLEALQGEDGPDLLLRVIETFTTSSTKLLSAAREAFATNDPDAVARAAHTLKSSSAQLGAERLSVLCKDLEARVRAHSLDGVQDVLEQINGELETVHEHLSAQRPGARGG
jgi:HPt (histidine-containing phosphotransfer) domain-containing protein